MAQVKYKDWSAWWDGLRSKAIKAGAEAVVTNLTALMGTNGVDAMHIPGLGGIGMGWKTAISTLVIQFTLRTVMAAALYVQNKPDPDEEVKTVDTQILTKTPAP